MFLCISYLPVQLSLYFKAYTDFVVELNSQQTRLREPPESNGCFGFKSKLSESL